MNKSLVVKDLRISSAATELVKGISFELESAGSLAIIGESGSGKTMTARAIANVLPAGISYTGEISVSGKVVLLLQDPFTSLSPVHTCGDQISWTLESAGANSATKVVELLSEVQLPERVANQYPHELSGGMRQRVAIAAALASNPDLLIADEPTSALDASTRSEILDLLQTIQSNRGMSLILISHDLGLVKQRAEHLLVMQNGNVVESGPARSIFENPQDDYTKTLLAATPVLESNSTSEGRKVVTTLRVTNMSKNFGSRQVLSNASLEIGAGEIVSLLGESGCGKTTLARCVAGLEIPNSGEIFLKDKQLGLGRRNRDPKDIQIVFQDPYSTLNPFFTIEKTLTQALIIGGRSKNELANLLVQVGLTPEIAKRRPRQLSGGQRQRVAIARAIALNPNLLICDEAVAALDVTIQTQIIELLLELRSELGISILFISHDIAVVSNISDFVYVMDAGEIVESGTPTQILKEQKHSATAMLVCAARLESI